ncbi:MAG: hypothetical protein EBS99_06040 [Betaproteobacteria bacterium]|nr:hypothetical protein [Betaproteobacteria bacterium]
MSAPMIRHYPAFGLSLLEMLVALALSLTVCAAALALYQGSAVQSMQAIAASQVNDDVQAALELMRQHVEMAGYNPPRANRPADAARNTAWAADAPVVRGCDALGNGTNPGTFASWKCPAPSSTGVDAIAVRYEADAYNTWPTAQGEPTQCLGGRVDPQTVSATTISATGKAQTGGVNAYVAEHLFYVATASRTGIRTLYCRPSNGTAQPMLENVEDLQILYGVGPVQDGEAGTLAFISATEVDRRGASAWAEVRAVRLCIVVRAGQAGTADSTPQPDCQGAPMPATDRRLRRSHQVTWVLHNRLWP